jgi:hypothetical protein
MRPDDEPCRGVDCDPNYEPSEPLDSDPNCGSCDDYGFIYLYHASTDAILGTRPCPDLGDPVRHPPAAPVPVAAPVITVLGHDLGCDGSCSYPSGCPPF